MDCERRETQYITFGFKMDLFYSKLKHKTQFKDNAHTVRKYAMQQQHAEHTRPYLKNGKKNTATWNISEYNTPCFIEKPKLK